MMKETIVVSAFPACGKSYVFNNQDNLGITCLDSDSSEFSWVKDSEGNNTKERNPDFPSNYIKHIKDNIGKVDFIFVSSHNEVVQALEDNSITWVKVSPEEGLKAEWVGRFWLRGNDSSFIKFISDNWDTFTDTGMDYGYDCLKCQVVLGSGEYISEHLDWIRKWYDIPKV